MSRCPSARPYNGMCSGPASEVRKCGTKADKKCLEAQCAAWSSCCPSTTFSDLFIQTRTCAYTGVETQRNCLKVNSSVTIVNDWSACSVTCGIGIQTRTISYDECNLLMREEKECLNSESPGKLYSDFFISFFFVIANVTISRYKLFLRLSYIVIKFNFKPTELSNDKY